MVVYHPLAWNKQKKIIKSDIDCKIDQCFERNWKSMEYYIWKVKGSSILVMSGKPDILQNQTTRTYDQVVLN